MRLTVIQNGRIRDKHIRALRDDYAKRFSRYGKLSLEEKNPKPGQDLWPSTKHYRILLDENGRNYTSEALAQALQKWTMQHGPCAFVIGDAHGHDEATRKHADHLLALSPLCLPHQLAHLLLIEQLYRAASILAGSPYHHA